MTFMQATDDTSTKRLAARNRFLAACSLAGAATTAYRRPNTSAADSNEYWIDIARLGSPDAAGVLVLSCGLNGEEGLCGSTVMTEWLSSGYQRDVPRDIGVIMMHTVLPVAHTTGSAPAPENAPQRGWSDTVLSAAARRFASYAELKGKKSASKTAPTVIPAPDMNWMETASDVIVDEVIEHARNVALLEFHTSLRPYGEIAIASCHPATNDASSRLKKWFEDDVVMDEPAILDIFALGFGKRLTGLSLTAAHVEFGAYTMGGILGLDARKTAAERHADVRSMFSPDSDEWHEHIRAKGIQIVGRALAGLGEA
jgi:hypothetical protein